MSEAGAEGHVDGPMYELVVDFPRPYALHNGEDVLALSDCEVRIPFLFREDAEHARSLTDVYVREVPADPAATPGAHQAKENQ